MAGNKLEDFYGTRHKSFTIGKVIQPFGATMYGPTIFQGPTEPVSSDGLTGSISPGDIWIETGSNPNIKQFSTSSTWISISNPSQTLDPNAITAVVNNAVSTYLSNVTTWVAAAKLIYCFFWCLMVF